MPKGGTVYQTIILNRNQPFMLMFVVLVTTKAFMGAWNKNPYNFMVEGFKGKTPLKPVALTNITATQNQKKLNEFFHSGNKGAKPGFEPDYFRTCLLSKAFQQLTPQFPWSRPQWEGGYGVHLFSCAALQSHIGSPNGRLTAGPVEVEFQFSDTLEEEVTAIFVCINPEEGEIKPSSNQAVDVVPKKKKKLVN
jgi:hypothetical protein